MRTTRVGLAHWMLLLVAVASIYLRQSTQHAAVASAVSNQPTASSLRCGAVQPALAVRDHRAYVGLDRLLITVDARNQYAPEATHYLQLPTSVDTLSGELDRLYAGSSTSMYKLAIDMQGRASLDSTFAPKVAGTSSAGTTTIKQFIGVHDHKVWLLLELISNRTDPPFREIQQVNWQDLSSPNVEFSGFAGWAASMSTQYVSGFLKFPNLFLVHQVRGIAACVAGLDMFPLTSNFSPVPTLGLPLSQNCSDFSIQASDRLVFVSGNPRDAVLGNFAGFIVFDISDSRHPVVRGHLAIRPRLMGADGTNVIALDGNSLLLIDVRDPDQPRVRGQSELSFVPSAVAMEGTRVYVVESSQAGHTLHVIDVSDPNRLKFQGVVSVGCPQPMAYIPAALQ